MLQTVQINFCRMLYHEGWKTHKLSPAQLSMFYKTLIGTYINGRKIQRLSTHLLQSAGLIGKVI